MKLLSTVIFLTLCTSVFANEGEMLAKMKEHSAANIDKRIGYLQELKSCISSSADGDAIKKCRQDFTAKISTLKEGNESWKEGMKAERKAKKKKK